MHLPKLTYLTSVNMLSDERWEFLLSFIELLPLSYCRLILFVLELP
jgi:hypothetical protein